MQSPRCAERPRERPTKGAVVALPDVGPAEAVRPAAKVSRGRRRLAEQPAQIDDTQETARKPVGE